MARRRGRRGQGEGSISQRTDGRWHVRVDLGRGLDGQRQRKNAYASTEAEAIDLLRRLGGRALDGQLVTSSTPTVKAFLEHWLETGLTAAGEEWRPSTKRSYQGAVALHLLPAFGPLRLEQLTAPRIQQWLTDHKKAHGARRRIALAHATLRSALSSAKRLGIVTINAAEPVTVPRPKTRTIRPLTLDQTRTFLAAAHSHRLGALFSVALACGLRLGEATGLRWDNIDLETGELRIKEQLQLVTVPGRRRRRLVLQDVKTEKSQRTLALPQVCLDGLRAHRTRQLEERLKAGPRWQAEIPNLVFTSFSHRQRDTPGSALHPRNVLRALHRILRSAHLPLCRFHDLRHSCASMLLAQGVQLAEVSLLLGHSELRVTADLYTHLQKETAAKAARQMDAILAR